MALSKRMKTVNEKIDNIKDYDIEEAIELLKSAPKVKFNESVDLSINLGIDATKSDQGVRGSSTLPHGIGKNMNVVAFADGEDEKAAKDAGADTVGFEDLIAQVKKRQRPSCRYCCSYTRLYEKDGSVRTNIRTKEPYA
jgi:large subunit ribosomal protein L1